MDTLAIKALQRLLNAAGSNAGAEDGIYGPKTKVAVSAYMAQPTVTITLDKRSEASLLGVKDELVRVIRRAAASAKTPPFMVIEGVRSKARQQEMLASGASTTMNSRHLTGHAVDVVPLDSAGRISWDWALYHPLAAAIKAAAVVEGVAIDWGGDWKSFKDGPHWELNWAKYPK